MYLSYTYILNKTTTQYISRNNIHKNLIPPTNKIIKHHTYIQCCPRNVFTYKQCFSNTKDKNKTNRVTF